MQINIYIKIISSKKNVFVMPSMVIENIIMTIILLLLLLLL